jgi:hypothetical protein
MNRPPTPEEIIPVLWWTDWSDKERDAMQEALTAEWLIEQGLMPCPSKSLRFANISHDYTFWVCEDKTK